MFEELFSAIENHPGTATLVFLAISIIAMIIRPTFNYYKWVKSEEETEYK